ncbi:unnamed protein product, partial [Phaeothamnion confervicola]
MKISSLQKLVGLVGLVVAASRSTSALEPPTRKVLSNGIPVVVQDTYSSPTVSINIFIRVGSVHESADVNGISHFYEHMFFRGTPRRTGLQFKREIEGLGGSTNASTTRDYTHFYINLPKAYLRQGLEILADAYLNAEVAAESVKAERDVVLEEYRLGKNQPARIVSDRMYSLLFPKNPYGRSIIGTEDILKKVGREELLRHKHNYYVPARTSLIIIGDVDRAQVVKDCEQLFGSYHATGLPEGPIPIDAPPEKSVVINETSKTGQSQIYLAYMGPSVKNKPDVYEVDLLTFLLGYGKGSLLSKALKAPESGGDVGAEYLTQAYPGIINLSAFLPAGKEDDALKKMDEVIKQVQAGNFTDKDLERARLLLSNIYAFGNETNAGKADGLGFYETIDSSSFAIHYLEQIRKITKQQVIDAANKYLG